LCYRKYCHEADEISVIAIFITASANCFTCHNSEYHEVNISYMT